MIVILIVITTYILLFFYLFLQVGSPKHKRFFLLPSLEWYKGLIQQIPTISRDSAGWVGSIFPRSGCRKEQ